MLNKLIVWVWINHKVILSWLTWFIISLILGIYFFADMILDGNQQGWFLPGKTSYGHHQIAMACAVCHTPFVGVKQQTCVQCHGSELKNVNDSHSERKFKDPRNASMLLNLDASKCVSCHAEHSPERTNRLGVSVPVDFCIYCHAEIGSERKTHQNLDFQSCRRCHNYHDNTALYEDFLIEHMNGPDVVDNPLIPQRNWLNQYKTVAKYPIVLLDMKDADAPKSVDLSKYQDWAKSSHANAGVNCTACHGGVAEQQSWVDRPDYRNCRSCHDNEVAGFLASHHGMYQAQTGKPFNTGDAHLAMKAKDRVLNCMSCHKSHKFNTDPRYAAVDSCLACHADDHSRAYKGSSHFRIWNEELKGLTARNAGVSCATCHMPRLIAEQDGKQQVLVNHNQSSNLRPNQKMLREVCLHCHSLKFSLDALADPELIRNNFSESPSVHLPSIDMVIQKQRGTSEN